MAKIKIREFGPIREGFLENDGYIDIRKVTVFIGDQGSGKSTVAKLISTFSWMEKALIKGIVKVPWLMEKGKFRDEYLSYHRLENYFRYENGVELTEIDYWGERFQLHYTQGTLRVHPMLDGVYGLPQVMYVPAERNFIANVKNAKALKMTSDALVEFVTEYDNAKQAINGGLELPIKGTAVEYDQDRDIVNLRGKDYALALTEASSGYQSLVPLFLVSKFLAERVAQGIAGQENMSSQELERFRKYVADIYDNTNLTDDQRRAALSVLSGRFNKTAFINIVEEPEQNLFPTSQWDMLKSLLEFNSMGAHNQLVMTTHSPYVIAYLSLCIQAKSLWDKIGDRKDLQTEVEKIVPKHAFLKDDDSIFYQLKSDGSIARIAEYEGVPTDNNSLNESLRNANVDFDKLLEIEQGMSPGPQKLKKG